jgi:septal ring factor EnvC (AmiA/AmiB activator)
MTPEERFERIERQLEFLATHQAQLSASLETLREIAASHESDIAAHSAQIVRLADVVTSLAHVVEEQGRRMEEQAQRMEQQGRRTDERLNVLINIVERYFSNGHK